MLREKAWTGLLSGLLLAVACSAEEVGRFRPPAVPLVTHDPYFSIWSAADRLTDCGTTHWTGKPNRLTGLVRIDGKAFRVMGAEPADFPALPQTGVEVLPTRTVYNFDGESVRLTLTFMTPALPDDLDVLARPVTYIVWEAQATDGKAHPVQVYLAAAPEIAVNDSRQPVVWSVAEIGDLQALRIGSAEQRVLEKKGDDLRIDWGYLYLAATGSVDSCAMIGPAGQCIDQFLGRKPLQWPPLSPPLSPADGAPVLSFALRLGTVGAEPVRRWLMLAYDDLYSIRLFDRQLRPYWRRNGAEATGLLQAAARDYESLAKRCQTFDEQLMADLRRVGGGKYARLCALAYRQTLAGNKLAADENGMPLLFPKENFSNGCISTVDVLFPQSPFFLVMSPALAKAMLVPILDYASSPKWPYGYAPHDLGTYPHATGQVYGMGGSDGARMPVEESGNMLIMLAALARCEGNADLAKKYWPLLTKWADYLVANGLDPENQLCSADMFGHLPHCANLALKAIIGIGGYAQLCERVGKPAEAKKYRTIARDDAAKWLEMAKDEGRTRLAYHLPGTWGMKHNLIWDRVLGTKLFRDSVGDAEIAWYLKVQKKYGLPVDNRTDTSLIDWALWSIAPARKSRDFEALFNPIYNYANETPSRVPLSDWFVTTDAQKKGFQARPVVGGIYIRLLADKSSWAKWAQRAEKVAGTAARGGGRPMTASDDNGMATLPAGRDVALRISRAAAPAQMEARQWSEEDAWQWYNKQPWIVGFNFVTSTAVNDIEMWQADTFDVPNIDRELKIAASLGYNTARVFINYHLWAADPAGLKKRMDQYLAIADKHGIRTMFCPFDYCNFTRPRRPPALGRQGEPTGQHGGNWVESPWEDMAHDLGQFPLLKRYITDIVGSFAHDKRVLMWDLYNEPMPPVWDLTLACFDWAREARPDQPITVGHQQHLEWRLARQLFDRSDIATYHLYGRADETRRRIEEIRKLTRRPLVCTEWLYTRPDGTTDIADCLPIYKQEKIGAICWGMMQGRIETPIHDILRPDGAPIYPRDVEILRELTGVGNGRR